MPHTAGGRRRPYVPELIKVTPGNACIQTPSAQGYGRDSIVMSEMLTVRHKKILTVKTNDTSVDTRFNTSNRVSTLARYRYVPRIGEGF